MTYIHYDTVVETKTGKHMELHTNPELVSPQVTCGVPCCQRFKTPGNAATTLLYSFLWSTTH